MLEGLRDMLRNIPGTLVIRLVEGAWAVIIMSLVGSMIALSFWNQIPPKGGNAAEVNFLMFCAAFTLVSLIICIPMTVCVTEGGGQRHSYIILGIDILNLILYFCASIAMTVAMGVHSCNNENYTKNNRITNTTDNTAYRCRQAQATTAFLWISFLTFALTTFMSWVTVSVASSRADGAEPYELPKHGTSDAERVGVIPGTLDSNRTANYAGYDYNGPNSTIGSNRTYGGLGGAGDGARAASPVSDMGDPIGYPSRSYQGHLPAVSSIDTSSVVSR